MELFLGKLFVYTGDGQSQGFMVLFNVILLIWGAYSVYAANKMSKTLVPTDWLMTSEERMRARKPHKFTKYMAPRTRVFGIMCMIYGLFGIISDKLLNLHWGDLVVLAAFVVCIIWFFITLKKAKNEYI